MKILSQNKGFATISLALMLIMIPTATLVGMRFYEATQKSAQLQQSTTTKGQLNGIKNWLIINAADPDSDSQYELLKENAGNTLPLACPMKTNDSYNTNFKYYTWDLGVANTNATYSQTVGAPPIANLVGRIISAGKDGVFQTTNASVAPLGDDIMMDVFAGDVTSSVDNSGWKEDAAGNKIIQKNTARWVGIGTTTPTSTLDVRGLTQIGDDGATPDTATYGTFGVTRSATAGDKSYINMTKQGIIPWGMGISTDNSLIMGMANVGKVISSRMLTLNQAGNFGIGQSPAYRLDVNTNASASYAARLQTLDGYILLGAYNSGYAHMLTDRAKFWMNRTLSVEGGIEGYAGAVGGTYGSLSVYGSKNGWQGINFPGAGTIMMNAGSMGFFNSTDTGWLWNVDSSGHTMQYGNVYFQTANPTLSSSSYFVIPGGAYFNSGRVYTESSIAARGGLHDDAHANLSLRGGTSGNTKIEGAAGTNGLIFPDGTIQTTAATNNGQYHNYSFIVNGYAEVVQGTGSITAGKFTGYVFNNFTLSGFVAPVSCGNDATCTRNYAISTWSSGGHGGWYMVSAYNIPVNTVTTLW